MSAQVVWDIVRKNSAFKRSSQGITLSAEPLNLTNEHSFKASGFSQPKALGIVAVKSKKGKSARYAIVSKVVGKANKPSASVTHSFITSKVAKGAKAVATATEGNNSYRPDLKAAALARFSRLRKAATAAKATA